MVSGPFKGVLFTREVFLLANRFLMFEKNLMHPKNSHCRYSGEEDEADIESGVEDAPLHAS